MDGEARKKILIVDDEVDFLAMLKLRLEDEYDVILASDGSEAMEVVKAEKPDAVILDLVMEKMNGLDVLKAIRKTNKCLPVFILTAFSDPERFRQANKLSASGFIVKTGNLAKELRCIHSVLGMSGNYRK